MGCAPSPYARACAVYGVGSLWQALCVCVCVCMWYGVLFLTTVHINIHKGLAKSQIDS